MAGGSRRWVLGAVAPLSLACASVIAPAVVLLAGEARADVFTFRDSGGTQHFTNAPTDRRYRAMEVPQNRVTLIRYKQGSYRGTPRGGGLGLVRLGPEPIGVASEQLVRMIRETAERYELEPALVHAVVRAESGFNPFAVSSKGAGGLMQLMPGTASDMGVRDVFHPEDNLDGGAAYLRGLLEKFSGNVPLALAAYNAGPTTVDNYGGVPPYPETIEYLRRVLRFRQEYLHQNLRTLASVRSYTAGSGAR